jgi:outer membrane protein OmpA-like peptidoglycan-associated protein/opacity protein-like surface antigen
MRFRSTLLAATVLAVPFAAQAQQPYWWAVPATGLYIGAGAGINKKTSVDLKHLSFTGIGGGVSTPNLQLNSELGPVALGTIGWGFGNGLRVELEGDYRYNKFNGVSHNGTTLAVGAGGNEQLFGPMVNVAYDFWGLTPYFVPYIGAGVGWQGAKVQDLHAYGNTAATAGQIQSSNQTKGSFAYQAIVGAGLPIAAVPGLSLTFEYRFLGTNGNRDYSASGSITTTNPAVAPGASPAHPVTVVGTNGGVQLGHEFNNAFLIGFRYNFGVQPPPPPPAPVAAPAPAPARNYLVFFDWDKATLTDKARQIIREAAENSTHVQFTQIEVNGYTDTSGTPQYNMGLSIRRANAVAAELVKDGVPRNVIAIHGFGETHLLVPTGPGVREPQNRRVEIIIR